MEHLIEIFADYLFVVIVSAAGWIILTLKTKRGEMIVRGILAGVTGLVLGQIGGLFYYHERPFVVMDIEAGALAPAINSFPSQHALLVFAAALVVWFATKNVKIGLNLFFLASLVGVSRVLTNVHWPIDILGSFAAIIIGCLIWFSVAPLPRLATRASKWIDDTLQRVLPKLKRKDY